MNPASPTWGDIEDFLAADAWREIPPRERGGRGSSHVFYEKLLPDGRLLQTHISHARRKTMSPGRFGVILREQLEVSRDEFWKCIRSGEPVERPVPTDEPAVEHEAWVVSVLIGELHMTADELGALSRDAARQVVEQHWSRRKEQ